MFRAVQSTAITLLNINKSRHQSIILNGKFVIAYLFVLFRRSDEENHIETKSIGSFQECTNIEYFQSLHDNMYIPLGPLKYVAERRFRFHTESEKAFQLHLLIDSYVVDVSEAEEFLGVKRGSKTSLLCHIC